MIRLESLNVGPAKPLLIGDKPARSGIRKLPVTSAELYPHGFGGDEQADLKNHGGPDQAVYIYRTEDYAWWAGQLGRTLVPATFGENLTVSGFPEGVRIGDRLVFGEVLLEVSAARIPCDKLAARMNDPRFVKTFRQAERPGFYARVLQGGRLSVGDTAELIPNPEAAPSVLETFRWFYDPSPEAEPLREALKAPLAARLRGHLERKLAALTS